MAAASVRDVLTFHQLDRSMYDKLIAVGTSSEVARNVVALFMWMELIGVDIVNYVRHRPADQYFILRLAAEAEAILDCIRRDALPLTDSVISIPLTASLVSEPLDLGFFYSHRDVAARGIAQILDGVGKLIFDDYLHALLAEYEAAVETATAEALKWKLQPVIPTLPQELAKQYNFRSAPVPEDSRSMFVTLISKGSSLRREDVVEYFTEKWGSCVEKVTMEMTPSSGVTPVYGRIVFRSESFIGLVLNGKPLVKLTIKGRQLWARRTNEQRRECSSITIS